MALETKTKAAGAAGGSAAILTGVIFAVLPPGTPAVVRSLVPAVLTAVAALWAAYQARHTHSQAGKDAISAVTRTLAVLGEYQAHNRYAMVNSQQIRDLLDPDGLWASSFAAPPPAAPDVNPADPIGSLGLKPVTPPDRGETTPPA